VRLTPAFPNVTFTRPVLVTTAGDGTNRLFVVEHKGRVRVLENRRDVAEAPVFLDLRERVRSRHNEEGLLSLAFHPKYAENGRLYVAYTASDPRRVVIARYEATPDEPDRADPASESIVLEVEQPYGNHNGTSLLFGPDGYLYVGLGDGGGQNDPHQHGQNRATLLGSILRLDVDGAAGGRAYAIPPDNPFAGRQDAREEIWAYGLRNPWRMSFDRATGELWAGDVGQNRFEEINRITRGGNYGWSLREGRHPFRRGPVPADLIDPLVEYGRDEGISVIGGSVYRGAAQPALAGVYVYADYVSGRIWGLRAEDGVVVAHAQISTGRQRPHIASFGEDAEGELLACVFDRLDGQRGQIHRVVIRP
jgi:glucose/arabinose dehydrogenase